MSTKKTKKAEKKMKHKRVNDILLGPLERPALAFFVKIMPKWVTPDILTFLALFACFLTGLSFYLCHYNKAYLWLASFGILLNWFGDSLDGSLARYRKIERPRFGFYIDHNLDALGEVFVFLGAGLSPFAHFYIAVLPLICYLLMEVQAVSSLYVNNIFKISYGKLGPTELRALAIIGNTILFFMASPYVKLPFGDVLAYDLFLILIAVILLIMFIYSVNKVGRKLSKEEQKNLL